MHMCGAQSGGRGLLRREPDAAAGGGGRRVRGHVRSAGRHPRHSQVPPGCGFVPRMHSVCAQAAVAESYCPGCGFVACTCTLCVPRLRCLTRHCSAAGVDDVDSYGELCRFIRTVAERGGVRHFLVHARKCMLAGLTPAQNRSIPPLRCAQQMGSMHGDWLLPTCKQAAFSLSGIQPLAATPGKAFI